MSCPGSSDRAAIESLKRDAVGRSHGVDRRRTWNLWAQPMLPTSQQIEVAAYHLWERQGRLHGRDREDWEAAEKLLIYNLNYEPIEEYGLWEPVPRVLGTQPLRVCRICERNSKRANFGPATPVIPILPSSSLLSAQICQECQAECREPLMDDLARFWESLRSDKATRDNRADSRERRLLARRVQVARYQRIIDVARSGNTILS